MKPRKVKGVDPDAPLAEVAERIIRVRLDELCSFVPRALDPGQEEALHDMRIAAKRLRYLLEVTGPCFGPGAGRAAKGARKLQDVIGEIHDCDVMLPMVQAELERMRAEDATALRRAAGDADEIEPQLGSRAPNRAAYRGLEVLSAHLQARRQLLFERFLSTWGEMEGGGFAQKLERALTERPEAAAA